MLGGGGGGGISNWSGVPDVILFDWFSKYIDAGEWGGELREAGWKHG